MEDVLSFFWRNWRHEPFKHHLAGGLEPFLFLPQIWNYPPNSLSYISDGLKPPTSHATETLARNKGAIRLSLSSGSDLAILQRAGDIFGDRNASLRRKSEQQPKPLCTLWQ